jgi:hypothetical protein
MSKTIPLSAIFALVQYLEDEREHFEDMRLDGEDTSRHVYHDVKAVSDWLDTQPGVPTNTERKQGTPQIDDEVAF